MSKVAVAVEPWTDALYGEMRACAEAHFEEVDGGVEPARPFDLDLDLMRLIAEAGSLKVVIARAAGQVVGYFTWQIQPDVESKGLLIAQQGAWYVTPGFWRAAIQTFDASIEMLRAHGVQVIFPHHRTQGRGARIGRFFQRRGAKLIQHTYILRIGHA